MPRADFMTVSASRMSASMNSRSFMTSPNLDNAPRKLLSRTLTACPSKTSLFTRAAPMKPVPPVTRYFLGIRQSPNAVASQGDITATLGYVQLPCIESVPDIIYEAWPGHFFKQGFQRHHHELDMVVKDNRNMYPF